MYFSSYNINETQAYMIICCKGLDNCFFVFGIFSIFAWPLMDDTHPKDNQALPTFLKACQV